MLISLSDIQSKSNCHKNERLEIGVLEETLLSTEWCAVVKNTDWFFSGFYWGAVRDSD